MADDLTASSDENDARLVEVRVMPLVGLPEGSVVARKNSILASATSPANTGGTLATSALVARKSWFSTSIWLVIWASEMFWAAVFQTTWTTTGIRATPAKRASGPSAIRSRVAFSMSARAARYSALSISRR